MTAPITAISPYSSMNSDATQSSATTTGTSAAGSSSSAGSSSAGVALDPQAFLQLLVAQLQYQDPTNPVDTSTFMNQTAMLSQVQTMNNMSATLSALVNAQQAQAATEMLGKTVLYVDSSGVQQSGLVNSVSLTAGGPTVQVGSTTIPLTSVVGVTTPSAT